MNSKEMALYALMEEQDYSLGLIHTTLHAIGWSKEALDDLMIFIEDYHPTEKRIISKISEYLEKGKRFTQQAHPLSYCSKLHSPCSFVPIF